MTHKPASMILTEAWEVRIRPWLGAIPEAMRR
jgi:hypothetical protein